MGIQSNMNQALSLAGFFAQQTDWYKEQSAISSQKRKVQKAEGAFDVATADMEKLPPNAAESVVENKYRSYDETLGNLQSAEQTLFQLDPSAENYRQVQLTREGREEMANAIAEERSARALSRETRRLILSNSITNSFGPKTPTLTPEEKQTILRKNSGGKP